MRFERCLSKDSALALAVIAAANRASGGTVEIFETPDFIGKWRLRKLCGNVVEGTPPLFPQNVRVQLFAQSLNNRSGRSQAQRGQSGYGAAGWGCNYYRFLQ